MPLICERCSNVKLPQSSFLKAGDTIPLGIISTWNRDCPLCLTWLHLAGVEEFPECFDADEEEEGDFYFEAETPYHIVPFNTSTLFEDPPGVALKSWIDPVSFAVAEEENLANDDGQQLFNCVRGRGWLSPVSYPADTATFSPRILESKVDIAGLKQYLASCLKDHPACRMGFQREMTPIKLVDCTTYEVITRQAEEPYLSLSYVNSAVQEDTTRHTKGKPLSLPLPTLYEDAIHLTLQLGYNYIWIDNYCIPQEDAQRPLTEDEKVERKIQIRQMDQIYTRSDLTIIAAHGLSGLPGVTDREASRRISVGQDEYVVCPPTPAYEIENSDSNERSWCYQEATLATRRLVLLNRHAYFKCKTAHALESMHGEIQPRSAEHQEYDLHRWNEFEVFANISARKADPLDHIYNHLAEYTKRRLTRDKDILLAVAGVMAQLKATYPDLITVTGVPIAPRTLGEKSKVLDRFVTSLAWKTAFDCDRRPNFPSWSWAGWYLPGMVEERPPTFQAKGGTLPYLDPGEDTLAAAEGFSAQMSGHEGAESIAVDEELPVKLRDLDAELTFTANHLVVQAPVLEVGFERWCYDLPGDTQCPKGNASFIVVKSKVVFKARLFPPDDRFRDRDNWLLIALGIDSEKLVMLAVKMFSKETWERIGVVDLALHASEKMKTCYDSRELEIS